MLSQLRSRLQAVTVWLCIVTIALVGVVPAQGLVLCLEPDGSMALEIGSLECAGCSETGQEGIDSVTHEEGCPCVDISIFSLGERFQPQARSVELRLDGPWMSVPRVFAELPVLLDEPRGAIEVAPPRPPPLLALMRTVVLLV